MKKELMRYWRSKAFLGYLFSLIGIFLLTLGVLGVISVGKFNQNMRSEESRRARNRLYTVAQDMENQLEAMRETVVEIATLPRYRFENFQDNKYQELEMLESLKRYHPVCNISELFFIKYEKNDNIFTSSGKVMPLAVYLDNRFDEEYHGEITELLRQSWLGESERLMLYRQGEINLFIFSLERHSVFRANQNAVMCFEVKDWDLKKRIENIVGVMNGKVHIDFQNKCILDEPLSDEILQNENGDVLKLLSLDGNFTVRYIPDDRSFSVWKDIFSGGELIALLLCLLLILVFGVLAAWWNFRPVRRIAEKLGSGTSGQLQADWTSIEKLIDSMKQGSEHDSATLKQQYQMLREQITLLIVSGEYSKRVQEHMTILNMRMNAPVYGVICSDMEDKCWQEEHGRELYSDVKELAGEGVSLYPCWDNKGDFYILAAVEEEYQVEETAEMLQALLDVKEIAASVGVLGRYKDLEEIGKKAFTEDIDVVELPTEEMEVQPEGLHQFGLEVPTERYGAKQNHTAKLAVEYIRENSTNYDLSLDFIAQKFQITSSYLCRIIKQETGMSYKEYLTGLRMEAAKTMLRDPAVSVLDVCQRTGYNNVSHFIKVFQKHTGMTPAKYRDEQ